MELRPNVIPSRIDETQQWFLGDSCSPAGIISDGHDWLAWLPQGEEQSKNGFDSINCTNYSLLNNVETLGKRKYGAEFQNNLSERHRGNESGTTPYGNSLHNVCESLRATGALPEVFLPFDNTIDSWNKYYAPKPTTYPLWKVAESWKRKYQYNHDWVFLPGDPLEVKQAKMMEALKYSTLSVSGAAWYQHDDGLYYSDGSTNHAFDLVDSEKGKWWLVLDSYKDGSGTFFKKLAWNFNFGEAKRHSLEKKLGGDTAPEPTYTEYIIYRIKCYLKDILH